MNNEKILSEKDFMEIIENIKKQLLNEFKQYLKYDVELVELKKFLDYEYSQEVFNHLSNINNNTYNTLKKLLDETIEFHFKKFKTINEKDHKITGKVDPKYYSYTENI
jgi:uncharacterized Zn finger protein